MLLCMPCREGVSVKKPYKFLYSVCEGTFTESPDTPAWVYMKMYTAADLQATASAADPSSIR